MAKAYLDYYGDKNIIPVHQDLSDLKAHLIRREGLYRSLGIAPGLLAGKRVVELGPGTGDNAVYTAGLDLAEYVLVDGNPPSVDELRAKVASGALPASVDIVHSDILEYERPGHYDLVLCEGVIPHQKDPAAFLRHVAKLARKGGMVVFTTVSATAILPELCRRMVKPLVADRFASFDELLAYMTAFFGDDLRSLKGMSRRHEDWVLDNILHPWNAGVFTIPDAVAAIGADFDVQGSSPRFIQDWRWYKRIVEEDFGFNREAVTSYWRSSAAFLDYNADPSTAAQVDGETLEALCLKANGLHLAAWDGDLQALNEFTGVVANIADMIAPAMADTAKSLRGFVAGIGELMRGAEPAALAAFRPLFGQGQQYVSFIRRN